MNSMRDKILGGLYGQALGGRLRVRYHGHNGCIWGRYHCRGPAPTNESGLALLILPGHGVGRCLRPQIRQSIRQKDIPGADKLLDYFGGIPERVQQKWRVWVMAVEQSKTIELTVADFYA